MPSKRRDDARRMSRAGWVILDTIGKLHAYHHDLCGWCCNCASLFEINIAALITERGADCEIIGMAPVPCPRCGSRDTEHCIDTPPHGDLGDGDAAYPR